jgi:GH25 family lysozyme M1 (1,4-beta-N-acetylmuramidase)
MPVYFDSEVVQRDKSGRSDKLSKEKRTEMLSILCDKLLAAGVPCGVYASRSWLYNNLDMSKIAAPAEYNTWVAEYGVSQNKYYGNQVLWQYTSSGSVNGINGRVDLSRIMKQFNMDALNIEQPGQKEEPKPIEKSEWEKVLEIAKAELGYL